MPGPQRSAQSRRAGRPCTPPRAGLDRARGRVAAIAAARAERGRPGWSSRPAPGPASRGSRARRPRRRSETARRPPGCRRQPALLRCRSAFAGPLPVTSQATTRSNSCAGPLISCASALAAAAAVLAVDDAQLLDPVSAALVLHLTTDGAAFVLGTVRTGDPCPDAITSLWKDGARAAIELGRLSDEAVAAHGRAGARRARRAARAALARGERPRQPVARPRARARRGGRRGARARPRPAARCSARRRSAGRWPSWSRPRRRPLLVGQRFDDRRGGRRGRKRHPMPRGPVPKSRAGASRRRRRPSSRRRASRRRSARGRRADRADADPARPSAGRAGRGPPSAARSARAPRPPGAACSGDELQVLQDNEDHAEHREELDEHGQRAEADGREHARATRVERAPTRACCAARSGASWRQPTRRASAASEAEHTLDRPVEPAPRGSRPEASRPTSGCRPPRGQDPDGAVRRLRGEGAGDDRQRRRHDHRRARPMTARTAIRVPDLRAAWRRARRGRRSRDRRAARSAAEPVVDPPAGRSSPANTRAKASTIHCSSVVDARSRAPGRAGDIEGGQGAHHGGEREAHRDEDSGARHGA